MHRERLEELRGRVEGAVAGSRELDALIECEIRWVEASRVLANPAMRAVWRPVAAVPGDVHSQGTQYAAEPFTASLDAALALVERCLPGAFVTVEKTPKCERYPSGAGCAALTWLPAMSGRVAAATPALAVLAALLSSLSAEQDGTAARQPSPREEHVNLPQPPTEQDGEP